ncbi:MAG: diadenylate cyclase CdaA [Lachnospiraceae bacterium]|nr:diadenylate cyclase CdaA [Lachnospiraceae bacterium]
MESLKELLSKFVLWMRIPTIHPTDVLEIIIIAFIVYHVVKWVRTTRAWMPVKGLMLLLVCWLIASIMKMDVILWIFYNTIGVGITAIIIVFQPEIRRALEQLGQQSFTSSLRLFSEGKEKEERFSERTVEELVKGTFLLARHKTGALIVLEQEVPLGEYEETGIAIDAVISNQLLVNIFEHNTPLHDGAVIIRGNRIVAATCYLPVSKNMRLSKELGTRHRAGVGISEVTDSFTIIVSEQTGKVSLARNGTLISNIDGDYLRMKLQEIQKDKSKASTAKKKPLWKKGGERK